MNKTKIYLVIAKAYDTDKVVGVFLDRSKIDASLPEIKKDNPVFDIFEIEEWADGEIR